MGRIQGESWKGYCRRRLGGYWDEAGSILGGSREDKGRKLGGGGEKGRSREDRGEVSKWSEGNR